MEHHTSAGELWPVGTHVRTCTAILGIPIGTAGVIARVFPDVRMYYVEFHEAPLGRIISSEELELDGEQCRSVGGTEPDTLTCAS